jgi:hypothetical protein
MVVRIWHARLNLDRLRDFDEFVRRSSAPMFRQQPGLVTVVHARSGEEWRTITLWHDQESAEALETSSTYLATTKSLAETGILKDETKTETFELQGALVPDPEELLRLLGT